MSLLDRVKFDGPPDVLVWKWPHDSLSLGAQVIVNESQEALFYKGGQALDLFSPGTHTLTTANLPFLQKIVNLPFGGKTPFTAEVYFVSKAVALGQNWGTKTPFMILDPKYKVTIPLRAYGQFGLRVENTREFVTQIAGASGGSTRGSIAADTASKLFVAQTVPFVHEKTVNVIGTAANDTARTLLESLIVTCLQQSVGSFLSEQKVSVLDLPSQVLALSKKTHQLLQANFHTFGLTLVNFALESINFDASDESVKRLRLMLDEAARLEVVGEAYRRNQDFYRTDRQFDVLEGAAESGEQRHCREPAHAANCPHDSAGVNEKAGDRMSNVPDDDDDAGPAGPPRRGALIALLVIVALIAGGLWLARTLHGVGRLQDCVMSGRTNCAPVTPPGGG